MKKNNKIWLLALIPITGITVIYFIIFNFPSLQIFKDTLITSNYKLNNEDFKFFNEENKNSLTPIALIKRKERNDIKILKYKSYNIYFTKLKTKKHFSVDSLFLFKEGNISKTNLLRYYNYKINKGEFSINIDTLKSVKKIHLMGDTKKIISKKIDSNLIALSGKSNLIGIKFNSKNNPLNFRYESKMENFIEIIFYKEDSDLYNIVITPNDFNISNENHNNFIWQNILNLHQ